jgi:hypothetical protein
VETRLSNTVLKVESSPEILRFDAGISAGATRLNAEIEPPVLACKSFFTSQGDFVNQADLERQWAALKELLRTATFAEQEVLEVLSSGILQTETGKAIAGVFADAILRSIRPVGELTTASLREIVDVLCHLPPGKWQAAFGENVRFASGQSSEGVAGFIQSHLNHSSVQRDEQIANNELASDSQWEAIKQITVKARQYIHRSSESSLNSVLMMLEDVYRCRPTMKEAQSLIADFLCELGQPVHSDRVRWPDRFLNEVETLNDQLKPVEDNKETWLQWLVGPSWLESLAGHPVSLSAPLKALAIPVRTLWGKLSSETAPESPLSSDPSTADSVQPDFNLPKAKASAPSLLSYLQSFERNADFHASVATTGPRIPESFVGKLLYAFNVLDTFGALRLDNSHVSTACPDPKSSRHSRTYGADEFPAPSFDTLPTPLQTSIRSAPQWPALGQFAAQVDDVVSQIVHNMMPWDSAHCSDVEEVRVLLEPFTSFDHPPVYQPPSETLSDQPSVSLENSLLALNVVGEQLQSWLARMSASLVSSGVAVLSRTGDLIEQHPGKTAGVFAAYMAISNFYANWFLPEPEQAVDPLQGLELYPDAAPDENSVVHEYIVEGLEDLFEVFPEFASEVKKLISKSDYSDPTDDPQLIENLETLLQQSVPGNQNVTYQDYLHEITVLAASDAHDEIEADSDSESTSETAVTTDADRLMVGMSENIRKRRSLGGDGVMFSNVQMSENGVAAHDSASWLIQAGQRSLDAEISIGPGEEIAPGVTITQAADLFIKDFVEQQLIMDPSLFVLSAVESIIAGSDLPKKLKKIVKFDTLFRVEYITPKPNGKNADYFVETSRNKSFTLAELIMGRHEKERESREEIKIAWPEVYTEGFKSSVKEYNVWEDYQKRSDKIFSQSKTFEAWKENFKFKLHHAVSDYLNGTDTSEYGRNIADKYLNGEIRVRPIGIRQGKYSDTFRVSDAVFLSDATRVVSSDNPKGLFIFLDGDPAVIESPASLFEKDGKSIEEFPELRSELSKRIPLKNLLARDEDDFNYSQGKFEWSFNPVHMFKNYKWPYTPIVFGRMDGPTYYGENNDAFKDLFEVKVDKAKSDMDTMTSTWAERTTDKLLGILTDALTGFAIILALPGAPTAGIAFAMGAGASANSYVRGMMSDDPLEAYRHKANAIKGMIGQIAGPYIGRQLGRVFSTAVDSRIANKIIARLREANFLPKEITKHFPAYGRTASPLLEKANKIEKWIAPRVRNNFIIQDKINRKFTNTMVVGRLKSLGAKGPEVAQRLMDRSRVLYFSDPKAGYMYRGFAMRGDARSPLDVFSNGFKSSGSGVQASGYYNTNGAGAFHKGGKQGGYTYLIDGRGIAGSDVARNINWRAGSGLRMGSNPYQLSYAKDIPGSIVLGAYDSAGKFIPNPNALSRAIEKSMPNPFVDAIPFPIKNIVQDKNSTRAPIKLFQ